MTLWELRPNNYTGSKYDTRDGFSQAFPSLTDADRAERDPWSPWYDKNFGCIVCAETELDARVMATAAGGREVIDHPQAWLDARHSTCAMIIASGTARILMIDRKDA